jgi:hypothetical protein
LEVLGQSGVMAGVVALADENIDVMEIAFHCAIKISVFLEGWD